MQQKQMHLMFAGFRQSEFRRLCSEPPLGLLCRGKGEPGTSSSPHVLLPRSFALRVPAAAFGCGLLAGNVCLLWVRLVWFKTRSRVSWAPCLLLTVPLLGGESQRIPISK